MRVSSNQIIQKTFKDKEGNWALAAKPNLPIITWFVMMLLGYVLNGTWEKTAAAIGQGALFTWAWLELFQGVNYFRRALGAVVLLYTVWSVVNH